MLPSIRKTGGYMAPGAENAPLTEKTAAELIAAVQLLTEQLAARPALPQALALDDPPEEGVLVPGPAAKKRWMRTASEKLDLLAARKGQSPVTHRLNFFAPGSLLERIREYRPDSLMMVILGFPLIPS